MTPNAKRTLVLSFTAPYLYSDVVLYAKKGMGFKSWEDACKSGKTVAVVQGSSNVGLLKSMCSAAQIKEFAGGGPAVAQAVAADRADAGINDQASAGRVRDRVSGLPGARRRAQELAPKLRDPLGRGAPCCVGWTTTSC